MATKEELEAALAAKKAEYDAFISKDGEYQKTYDRLEEVKKTLAESLAATKAAIAAGNTAEADRLYAERAPLVKERALLSEKYDSMAGNGTLLGLAVDQIKNQIKEAEKVPDATTNATTPSSDPAASQADKSPAEPTNVSLNEPVSSSSDPGSSSPPAASSGTGLEGAQAAYDASVAKLSELSAQQNEISTKIINTPPGPERNALRAEQDRINKEYSAAYRQMEKDKAALQTAQKEGQNPPEVSPDSNPSNATTGTTDGKPNDNQTVPSGSDPAAAKSDTAATGGSSTAPNADTVNVTAQKTTVVKPAFDPPKDWRVRISLAKSAQYFYNLSPADAGILAPLKGTDGVIFPYMPTIQVGYSAQYESMSPTHSNYKIHNYQSSSVDNVTVSGDFTAQDVNEANYMLAVIHFFRTASKMFYGQDQNPARGVPPPLLYLTGLGQYQFDHHPMVLTNFSYTLPQDVDYINAYPNGANPAGNGVQLAPFGKPNAAKPGLLASGIQRLLGSGLKPGGAPKKPVFLTPPNGNNQVTRVPTKINISLTFLPIITRNAMSNKFSLKDYASGKLLRGSQNGGTGGGMW